MNLHPDWIVPDWPIPPGVRSLVTTRAGGASTGPYASLNLGFATDDDAEAVAANRARLRKALPADPRWLRQIHGSHVLHADTIIDRPEGDASWTNTVGVVCAIQVADCLPVLFASRDGRVVAAAHAGWRGLAGGVLANTVEALTAAGIRTSDVLAFIGPGIGADAFEVGNDVRTAFVQHDSDATLHFRRKSDGKWLADLPALARRALGRCGVRDIHGGDACTYSDPERFFSYRRDRDTGRMAALIWREA